MVWSTDKRLVGRKIVSQGKSLVLELMLVAVVVVFISSANGAPTAADLIGRGCTSKCGDFKIEYPFGHKEDCYFSVAFRITCNNSKPYLWVSTDVVLSVSVDRGEGELRTLMHLAQFCYNLSDHSLRNMTYDFYSVPEYSISTKNKLTAIGCDISGFVQDLETNDIETECTSQCSSPDQVENGTCSGFGCCQHSIPKGLSRISIQVRSVNNHTDIRQFNPCSYAFLVEPGNFTFSKTHLRDFNQETTMPMILDWVIENKNCQEARENPSSYACGENTDCIEAENARGYLCNCLAGYRGNPYLSDGCQDINECDSPEYNDCIHQDKCKNMLGTYTCSCPEGHYGDGRKNGEGCSANQHLVIHIVIGVCTGVGGFLLLGAAWWLDKVIKKISDKKLKKKFFKRNGGFLLQQQLSSSEGNIGKTMVFNSKELEKATGHYNEDRILGRGGQGTVYKGMLSDGRIVAIKKAKMVDERNVERFINEVAILSQINHRNVVKLLGCCLETEVPLLVYEFVPKGTLFQHIHDPNEEFPLLWEARLCIAIEAAEALYYLHYAASMPIYHRDIKSTNILLDDKYRAKVSDFGTSRLVAIDQTHLTTLVKGTFGYLDPEYFLSSQFTDKSDVYSFGVVIAELLTGEKPVMSIASSQEWRSLASYFIQSMEENRLLEILDPRILKECYREEIEAVACVAKRCLYSNGKKRPTMREVAVELAGIRMSRQGFTALHHDQQNYEEEYDAINVSV